MQNLNNFTFSDVKAIYDFLELRKEIVSKNPERFEDGEVHTIISKQKFVWQQLHSRMNEIEELKSYENE